MSVWADIETIAAEVKSSKTTATQLVEKSLKMIEDHKDFSAVIATIPDRSLERAKKIDQQIAEGKAVGRLAGVPFIAKDNFLTFGSATTAGSNILKGFVAPYQATAIERLESEGAICVAKANLDAFGHGGSTENSDFMITKNPKDKTRVSGGSSGGSAAAVILEMVPFAIGTDTGGSIRQPASFCGAVGYKPTYGLVSRSGVVAMASSTDTIGPLAKTVADAALVLDVMSGKDELDGTTIEKDKRGYSNPKGELNNVRVGLVKEYLGEGVDPGVREQILKSVEKLRQAGVEVVDISLPSLPLSLACYYIICPAEVSSNLSRYDGQRYGHSNKTSKSLDDSYNWSRSEGFGTEAKRRIMIGTYVLSSGYYDAYYKKAQTLRTKLIDEFNDAFTKVDFLIGPVTPTIAFSIGENAEDPLRMYLGDIMTVAPSLVGVPAISVPIGLANKLPVGLQIIGAQKSDHNLLSFAQAAERFIS